jgi:hypothetical protein
LAGFFAAFLMVFFFMAFFLAMIEPSLPGPTEVNDYKYKQQRCAHNKKNSTEEVETSRYSLARKTGHALYLGMPGLSNGLDENGDRHSNVIAVPVNQ